MACRFKSGCPHQHLRTDAPSIRLSCRNRETILVSYPHQPLSMEIMMPPAKKKSSFLKKIASAIGIFIVVILLGAGYLYTHLDRIVAAAIEKYGTAAAQTDVTVSGVNLAPFSGSGGMSNLAVANPKGFSSSKAISLGSIKVTVDPHSIAGTGPIVIHQIAIEKPAVSYELNNSGDSNLQTIQHNAQAYANGLQGGGSSSSASASSSGGKSAPGRKLIIEDLQINSGQLSISQTSLPKPLSTTLPNIHLTNIGKDSGGVTAAQVASQLLNTVSQTAAQSAVTELAKEKISGALKEVPTGAIGGAASDTIGNSVKSIFGQ